MPADDTNLDTLYSSQDYIDVNTKNDIRVSQTASDKYAIHQFKNYIGASPAIDLECELQTDLAPSSSTVLLQIYNRNTPAWETVDSDNTTGANIDFSLIVHIADSTDYKNGSNVISCRVYQDAT